jgi:hypothetical protein
MAPAKLNHERYALPKTTIGIVMYAGMTPLDFTDSRTTILATESAGRLPASAGTEGPSVTI